MRSEPLFINQLGKLAMAVTFLYADRDDLAHKAFAEVAADAETGIKLKKEKEMTIDRNILLANELRNLAKSIKYYIGARHHIPVTILASWATALEKAADELDPSVPWEYGEARQPLAGTSGE